MDYIVRKVGKVWWLMQPDGLIVDKFPTRQAAVLTGRILAGFRGTVVVARRVA